MQMYVDRTQPDTLFPSLLILFIFIRASEVMITLSHIVLFIHTYLPTKKHAILELKLKKKKKKIEAPRA